jgi:hypothetical protein
MMGDGDTEPGYDRPNTQEELAWYTYEHQPYKWLQDLIDRDITEPKMRSEKTKYRRVDLNI